MGQSQDNTAQKKHQDELKVDSQLNKDLNKEIQSINNTNNIKYNGKGKIKNQGNENINLNKNSDNEETEEEEENEIYLSYITELVDSIYSKNINMQLKNRPNNSVYETVFDIRNIIDSKKDLKNNEYNKKSLEKMNEIIEPDISDKMKNEKKRTINDNDKAEEEEEENSNEDKSESFEKDFFKNWDYHYDIFENEKEEKELNLDFDDNDKGYNKSNKSVEILRKGTKTKSKKRSYTNNNKLKNSSSMINKNKLILLDDIITSNNNIDINKIENQINNNINQNKNLIIPQNINKKEEQMNGLENIKSKLNINNKANISSNNSRIYINKENDSDLQDEKFEIMKIDSIISSNRNHNYENSNEIIFNKKISSLFRDEDNPVNLDIKDNENMMKKREIQLKTIKDNLDNIGNNSSNMKNYPSLHLNPNNAIYKRKVVLPNKNIYNNYSKHTLKNNPYIDHNYNEELSNFHEISDLNNNENNYINQANNNENKNFKQREIYNHKPIRAKTPIIKKPRNLYIKKEKIINNNIHIINTNNNKTKFLNIKPTESNQTQLYITHEESFDFTENKPKYISKTPIKKIRKKPMEKPRLKINLMKKDDNNTRESFDLNKINQTISLVQQKIKSIESNDKKLKNIYNINNKYINKNININNFTSIDKYKKHKKKKKIVTKKTYEEYDTKGYKDIMPQIYKKKEEKNNIIFNPAKFNRSKSTDIQLRKKKAQKNKTKNNENISNFIYGKQRYYDENEYQEKGNINHLRIGMRRNIEE